MQDQAEFTLEESDYVAFNKLHMRAQAGETLVVVASICLVIFCLVFVFERDLMAAIGPLTAGLLVGVLAWFLCYLVWSPAQGKKLYRETASLKLKQEWEIRQDGLHISQQSGHNLLLWSDVFKWDEDKKLLVIYANSMLGYLLAKRKVPEEFVDRICNELQNSGLSKKRVKRK